MKIAGILILFLLAAPAFADIAANASITPRYVDTSVPNQVFVYRIDLGNETINKTTIFAPPSVNVTGVSDVTLNGTSCLSAGCVERQFNISQIIINFSTDAKPNVTVNNPIIITFTANTSASASLGNFTSMVHSNSNNATVGANGTNSVQVGVQSLLNATPTIIKHTAVVNGSDYWEFNFTLGFNQIVNGTIFFKMTDWRDASNRTIQINTSSTASYASMRTVLNATDLNNTFNVTSLAYGGSINSTALVNSAVILRMLIPVGAAISSSWATTYSFLFRSSP